MTAEEIRKGGLPLSEQDFLPETPEEKVICLADKFFSKSGKQKEKDLETVIRSMKKFGSQPNDRFEALAQNSIIRKIPVLNADCSGFLPFFSVFPGKIKKSCFFFHFFSFSPLYKFQKVLHNNYVETSDVIKLLGRTLVCCTIK